jgi:hypothetical protein
LFEGLRSLGSYGNRLLGGHAPRLRLHDPQILAVHGLAYGFRQRINAEMARRFQFARLA